MTESREHHVDLRLVRGYEFVATLPSGDHTESMIFDEPPPLGDASGPNATTVLAAAVGDCLAASFAYCLRKVRLEPVDLKASVVAHVARNQQGRLRVTARLRSVFKTPFVSSHIRIARRACSDG